MVEAVRTTASSAAIWTICVVAVVCLASWLAAIAIADRNPYWRHWQRPNMPGPVLGGIHAAEGGRSVAPNRDAPAVFTGTLEMPAQRAGGPVTAGAAAAAGQAVPPQRGEGAGPGVPAQRGGEADRPERTAAGSGMADQGGAGS